MELLRPAPEHVESYLAALRNGWSPDSTQDLSARVISEVEADPAAYVSRLEDRDPAGRTLTLPDGTQAPRLPSCARWMWDGEFCGSISLRWQAGTTELPPTCLGHIGYSVVAWKRRRGYATQALRDLLPLAGEVGLPFVEITTDPDNLGSQRVIEANGGILIETFDKLEMYGGGQGLRYRIDLREGGTHESHRESASEPPASLRGGGGDRLEIPPG